MFARTAAGIRWEIQEKLNKRERWEDELATSRVEVEGLERTQNGMGLEEILIAQGRASACERMIALEDEELRELRTELSVKEAADARAASFARLCELAAEATGMLAVVEAEREKISDALASSLPEITRGFAELARIRGEFLAAVDGDWALASELDANELRAVSAPWDGVKATNSSFNRTLALRELPLGHLVNLCVSDAAAREQGRVQYALRRRDHEKRMEREALANEQRLAREAELAADGLSATNVLSGRG
jgi:hypothetical protein